MAPINKIAYIEDGGRRCPYCGNSEIDGGVTEFSEGSAKREMICLECNAFWTEVYTLADIAEEEEEDEPRELHFADQL